jgi:hypothetical protein
MDAAAVSTALQWSKRTGKFSSTEANFREFVSNLATVAVDSARVESGDGPVLGKGAFGLIERATFDGRPVAVKSLKAAVTSGPKPLSQIMVGTRSVPSKFRLRAVACRPLGRSIGNCLELNPYALSTCAARIRA